MQFHIQNPRFEDLLIQVQVVVELPYFVPLAKIE